MEEIAFLDKLAHHNRKFFLEKVHLEKGHEILNENDQCSHVLFVIKGSIEVYKISENGKVFNLYTILPGESCVLNLSCVLSNHKYMAFARAVTDIECVLLPQKVFLDMFHEEESLRTYVFELISTRLIQITSKVEGIVLESLERRLKRLLLEQGTSTVYMTHEELANHLGSAREVISRQLKRWEKEDKVKLYRGKIELLEPYYLCD